VVTSRRSADSSERKEDENIMMLHFESGAECFLCLHGKGREENACKVLALCQVVSSRFVEVPVADRDIVQPATYFFWPQIAIGDEK
jgi:hypothetical protein